MNNQIERIERAARNRKNARRMRDDGKTFEFIAKKLGVSVSTAKSYLDPVKPRGVDGKCECGRIASHKFKGKIFCDDCLNTDWEPQYKDWRTSSPTSFF